MDAKRFMTSGILSGGSYWSSFQIRASSRHFVVSMYGDQWPAVTRWLDTVPATRFLALSRSRLTRFGSSKIFDNWKAAYQQMLMSSVRQRRMGGRLIIRRSYGSHLLSDEVGVVRSLLHAVDTRTLLHTFCVIIVGSISATPCGL